MKNSSDINRLSTIHSVRCFFNSLLREYKNYTVNEKDKRLELLFDDCIISIGLIHNSQIGRYSFNDDILLIQKNNEAKKQLNFKSFVEVVLNKLSLVYTTDSKSVEVFKARVFDSHNNISENLTNGLEALEALFSGELNTFIDTEQSLFSGHSFHPHPKNRDGFSLEDSKLYTPESKGAFKLKWLLVNPKFLNRTSSKKFEDQNWALKLFKQDTNEDLVGDFYPIPVHPWQLQHLLKHDEIKKHIDLKNIIIFDAKKSILNWSATSSLRSIYNVHADYMLKFSLSVRLTNSVRHLLPTEVVRGIQVYDVFKTPMMKEFSDKHPQFEVVFEPAFTAILDSNGKIINESIVSLRENVFKEEKAQNKYVLASLLQDHPTKEISLAGALIQARAQKTGENISTLGKKWFELFLDYGVIPLLYAQARFGIMLGAHQQNFVIEIKDGLPSKGFFRDCQGTGYSEYGFTNFAKDVESLVRDNGNILDGQSGNSLFSYYLFINSAFNAIAIIARDTNLHEDELSKILVDKLIELKKSDIVDSRCIDYLLEADMLLQKGNFLCSIINLNENTTENPLAIYNQMNNPLKGVR